MPIPRNITVLPPWKALDSIGSKEFHASEVNKEISAGHVLFGAGAEAVASRTGRDDVLFGLRGTVMLLAVVHPTWQGESNPRWPRTRLFKGRDEWAGDETTPGRREHIRWFLFKLRDTLSLRR